MRSQEEAMLKALLAGSPQKEKLIHFFAPEIKEALQGSLPPAFTTISPLFSSTKWLSRIHYSWFHLPLKQMASDVRPLFFSLLTSAQQKGLSNLFQQELKKETIIPFVANFVSNHLKEKVQENNILDVELLPASKMIPLLRLTKMTLIHVIDLLGVHDLAVELRYVLDKELLGKIHGALTPEQLHFLHYASKQAIKWFPPKLKLSQWDGSKQPFLHTLHQRGLIRLGKAIGDEHESFRWHLLHRLDTGRANVILRTLAQKPEPSLIPYFKGQVLHIIKRYQS